NQGRVAESFQTLDHGQRVDPFNPGILVGREYVLVLLGRYREAIEASKRIFEIEPETQQGYVNLGEAYLMLGKADSAVMALEHAARIDSIGFGIRPLLAFAYAGAGRWSDVDRLKAMAERETLGNSPDYNRAMFASIVGDVDAGAAAYARGIERREPLFLSISPCEPILGAIRSRPAFVAAVASFGGVACPTAGPWPVRPRAHAASQRGQ
ncbi:MAG: hypothetical protein ABIY52_00330, partial [Gemmatimonadaceae bacterium]